MTSIHATAIVDSATKIGNNVEIGPYAIVGPGCELGDGVSLAAHAILERNVKLASGVKVGSGSIIGGDPQDLKYAGEETFVEIGANTVVREYATINRGTRESLRTTIGSGCFVMSYAHVAHDCHVGDNVILANMIQLAGHVTVGDRAIISAMSGVHQFVRIGTFAFVGGFTKVVKGVPPYVRADGNPCKLFGLNSVGLQRNGFTEQTRLLLKRAYRLFFESGLNTSQALEKARSKLEMCPEVANFVSFIEESDRGVHG